MKKLFFLMLSALPLHAADEAKKAAASAVPAKHTNAFKTSQKVSKNSDGSLEIILTTVCLKNGQSLCTSYIGVVDDQKKFHTKNASIRHPANKDGTLDADTLLDLTRVHIAHALEWATRGALAAPGDAWRLSNLGRNKS